jgi:hypothetical protein
MEAGAVLFAFPLAVAMTVVAISAPARSRPAQPYGEAATTSASVAISGADPVPTFALADRLAASGYDVVSVEASRNSLSASTVVVYYERDRQTSASRLRELLGVGTIRLDQVFQPGSDLMILLGKDLRRT